jgi:predicted Fe-Mo cluster-binding NifX family protein
MNISRTLKLSAVLLAVMILTMAIYGFAAGNTVPVSKAGDGEGTVSGYTISAVTYTLNTTNPGNIDSVSFTTSPAVTAGSTIKIKLVNAGTTWFTCSGAGTTSITCTTTGADVLSADKLRVVIAD